MAVFVCLAEHAGQIVSKETLMKQVWRDVFVTEDVLTRAIFELRRALHDQARKTLVQTIPKRGYRLALPPKAAPEDHARTPVPQSRRETARQRTPLPPMLWLAVPMALVAIGWWLRGMVEGSHPDE